jgi:redox-regulated HSP33 family molecular chaperone
MVKALQRWLDTHQLPAIIAAVLGVVLTISVLMVAIGYLVTRP